MITTNTILQIDITEELTCPHIAATHPSTPNLHKANESRPKSSRQAFFNSLLGICLTRISVRKPFHFFQDAR
ncbi:MAG: hypothetical protein E5299_02476 [Burkholderia gladioli]|nr:MAG: hypothetical protein E5299_02476 [Burkholderia gladioli]